jgi:hypothetical protein
MFQERYEIHRHFQQLQELENDDENFLLSYSKSSMSPIQNPIH